MKKDSLIIGLALFAMFFGAGNLIFPPYLGMTSGSEWLVGFACFVFIDVVLSCLGIFAINAAGGSIKAVQGALGTFAGIALNSLAIICTGFSSARRALPRRRTRCRSCRLSATGEPLAWRCSRWCSSARCSCFRIKSRVSLA